MNLEERSRARFIAGDPLRAIAALGVVFGHTFAYALTASGHDELVGTNFPGLGWLAWPVVTGPEMVFIFFALSGYLIGRPFIRAFVDGSGFPSVGRYLKHRLLRIVPGYWVVLTICLLVIAWPSKPLGPVIQAYFFLLDWNHSPIEGILSQAWTLRVELRFYLALPVVAALFVGLARLAGPRVGRTARCWTVIVLALAWGAGSILITDAVNPYTEGAGVLLTAFAFAPGVMLAGIELLPFRAETVGRRYVAWAAGVAVVIAGSIWIYPWFDFMLSGSVGLRFREILLLTMILGGLLVWQWSGRRTWRVLDNPLMRWIGSRSYGIYLLHMLVLNQIAEVFAQGDRYRLTFAVLLPATLVVTCLAAELLYRLVERPAMNLRNVPVRDWFNWRPFVASRD